MSVEVKNGLGSVLSDELQYDAWKFGKIWAFALGKSAFYTIYGCVTSAIFFTFLFFVAFIYFLHLFYSETQSTIRCPTSC